MQLLEEQASFPGDTRVGGQVSDPARTGGQPPGGCLETVAFQTAQVRKVENFLLEGARRIVDLQAEQGRHWARLRRRSPSWNSATSSVRFAGSCSQFCAGF